MKMGTSTLPDRSTIKELGRRRVFGFFWVFAIVAIANTIRDEGDTFSHVIDNYLDIALGVIALVVILVWLKKDSFKQLRMTNNINTILAVLLIVVTIATLAGLTGETTTEDLADDIPTLFFGVFMLINRFV